MNSGIHNLGPGKSAERECYDYLRGRILSGAMPGGTPVHQQQVADQLGLSRIPVRDALKHLVAEGLISIVSSRHVVTIISLEDIDEIFMIRSALEGLSARMAAERMTEASLAALSRLINRMEASEANAVEWLRHHDEFHQEIHRHSNMPRLRREIERLGSVAEHYLRVFFAEHSMREVSGYEHRLLVDALTTKDGEVAERAMRAHIEGVLREISEFMGKATKAGVPATKGPDGSQARPATDTAVAPL